MSQMGELLVGGPEESMTHQTIGDDAWTSCLYVLDMLTSYVIRFTPDFAKGESFNGEVEGVASGHREIFGSIVQLTQFILDTFPDELARTEIAQRRRDSSRA
jgi:hypothetical protein